MGELECQVNRITSNKRVKKASKVKGAREKLCYYKSVLWENIFEKKIIYILQKCFFIDIKLIDINPLAAFIYKRAIFFYFLFYSMERKKLYYTYIKGS